MTSAHQKLLLSSLCHSSPDKLDMSSTKDYRSVVAWLEHTKIRNYAQEDRRELTDAQSQSWPTAFQLYLEDLDCPMDFDAASAERPDIMDWLLHYAVDLVYEDNADRVKAASALKTAAPKGCAGDSVTAPAFTDLGHQEVHEAVAVLLRMLGIEPDQAGAALSQQLAAAKQALSEQVLPTLKDAKQRKEQQGGQAQDAANGAAILDPTQFPLGFSTGDDKVDAAATILRMLLIKDLRGLQTQIDDMIVQIQEFTANPRVNTGLGKVGR